MATAPRLLIVDDEPDTCANLADIFGELGYEVDVAHDGLTALRLVHARAYDVALLDFKMPGMNGLELYRAIRKISAGTVAIVVTAYASSETTRSVLTAGAWQVLAKPVDFTRLHSLVSEALDQPLLLVVDDDEDLCQSLWDLFREQGYRVSLAHDVPAAAAQLARHEHQVVIADMKLPQGDGADVAGLVRQANPAARTLLITGHRSDTEQKVARALAEGAEGICYKPFEVPQLLAQVSALVRRDGAPS